MHSKPHDEGDFTEDTHIDTDVCTGDGVLRAGASLEVADPHGDHLPDGLIACRRNRERPARHADDG